MLNSARTFIVALLNGLISFFLAIVVIVGWSRIFSGHAHPVFTKYLGSEMPLAFILTILATIGMTGFLIRRITTWMLSPRTRNAD